MLALAEGAVVSFGPAYTWDGPVDDSCVKHALSALPVLGIICAAVRLAALTYDEFATEHAGVCMQHLILMPGSITSHPGLGS